MIDPSNLHTASVMTFDMPPMRLPITDAFTWQAEDRRHRVGEPKSVQPVIIDVTPENIHEHFAKKLFPENP